MDSQTTSTKQPTTPFTNRGNEKWLSEERMPYPDGYFEVQPLAGRSSLPTGRDESIFGAVRRGIVRDRE